MKKNIAGGVLLAGVIIAGAIFGGSQFSRAAASQLPPADTGADVQYVEAQVEPFAYPQITLEANRPVRINFKVDAADLNSCNNEIIIPEWNIRKSLTAGDNYVEFTPTQTGTFNYSCWMNMIGSTITVIEQGSGETGAQPLPESANTYGGCGMSRGFGGWGGGCCGVR